MAGLRELKKHLSSVKMTGQLAGAMKTVSAAKFSRVGGALDRYAPYAAACRDLTERFGSALSAALPCVNSDAPVCLVILGSNRGLCGGYNAELLRYADAAVAELAAAGTAYRLVVCGKTAIAHFRGAAAVEATFVLPDTATYADCADLNACIAAMWREGSVSRVELIGQKFVNMLIQTPHRVPLLPLATAASAEAAQGGEEPLYIPDRETFLRAAASTCVSSQLYAAVLDACAGAQAATLMAMRSAYDNAEQSAAALETVISRKRQSEVTASVIETSGGFVES